MEITGCLHIIYWLGQRAFVAALWKVKYCHVCASRVPTQMVSPRDQESRVAIHIILWRLSSSSSSSFRAWSLCVLRRQSTITFMLVACLAISRQSRSRSRKYVVPGWHSFHGLKEVSVTLWCFSISRLPLITSVSVEFDSNDNRYSFDRRASKMTSISNILPEIETCVHVERDQPSPCLKILYWPWSEHQPCILWSRWGGLCRMR